MNKPKSRWTFEECDLFKKYLIEQKLSYGQCAKLLYKSVSNCQDQAKRLGLNEIHFNSRRPWKPEDVKQLEVLRAEGLDWQEIADRLNRTSISCRHRAQIGERRKRARHYKHKILLKDASEIKKMRKCLGPNCRGAKEFLSAGPWERLCKSCSQAINTLSDGSV